MQHLKCWLNVSHSVRRCCDPRKIQEFTPFILVRNIFNMPKQVGNKDTLRHIKYKARLSGRLPVPGVIDLVVVGNGAKGCPKSVVVTTGYDRYLFNCGEGTQRLAIEHKLKIARLGNIFITHKSWDNIGGLPGMALTLQSTNVPEITLHGPPSVECVITKATSFSMLTGLKIVKQDPAQLFEDNTMTVETVPVYATTDGDMNSDGSRTQDVACFYICTPQQVQGKLDFEKAMDLGIPRGPALGQLKDGKEVTLDDGTVIKPAQVLSDVEPVMPFVVLECPSTDHIQSLVTCPELAKFQQGSGDMLDVIVHMTPSHVMSDGRYQDWMKRFGPRTNHLIVNDSNGGVCHRALYRIQAKLNQLHNTIFPLLPNQVTMNKVQCFDEDDSSNIIQGYSNMKYRLRPRNTPDRSQCVMLDNDSFVGESKMVDGYTASLEQLKTRLRPLATKDCETKPEVVFLGTGSSAPSKERNVSSILLNISPDDCMLFDCGEGTSGQLYRFYGKDYENVLCRLSLVFVSHMHADHHLGLFSILEHRRTAMIQRELDPVPLAIIAPFHMKYWLDVVDRDIMALWQGIEFISIQHVVSGQMDTERRQRYDAVLQKLRLKQMLPVAVRHCKHAYGVVVSHEQGWKVVYSGDTMPCDALVEAGRDCDLLIHEATMEDDMEDEALLKTHSTTSQAIDIGMKMNARFILLNHFSQRYAKIPLINDMFSDKVGISFDNMRVSLDELPILPHFTPTLKLMFQEHYAEMEEKLSKRSIKRKLDEEIEKSNQSVK